MKKKRIPPAAEIQGFWEAAEECEPDISTDRLIAMVCDWLQKDCGLEYEDAHELTINAVFEPVKD